MFSHERAQSIKCACHLVGSWSSSMNLQNMPTKPCKSQGKGKVWAKKDEFNIYPTPAALSRQRQKKETEAEKHQHRAGRSGL